MHPLDMDATNALDEQQRG